MFPEAVAAALLTEPWEPTDRWEQEVAAALAHDLRPDAQIHWSEELERRQARGHSRSGSGRHAPPVRRGDPARKVRNGGGSRARGSRVHAVVFYAVVSDEIQRVIEFFPSRFEAEAMLARVSATSPTGATGCTSSRSTSPPAGPTKDRSAEDGCVSWSGARLV
jgi:hypothetical protein